MLRTSTFSFLILSVLLPQVASADWLRFRGPNGSGIAADTEVPTKWSPKENLRWQADLPGAGVSSPIVVGDRVFVTCYSGYGIDRQNPGSIEDLKRHLVCVDRESGKLLWDRAIKAALPEDPYSGIGVPSHGYASHTPVSDGNLVYAFFGKSGVYAFDMDGHQKWHADVGKGSDRRRWGSSSSPILHNGTLIVVASAERQTLFGLDASTGKELWQQQADGVADVWGTPVLAKIDDERTDLVLGVPYEIWGLNPTTGKLRWYAEATNSDQYSSSVVESEGLIYGIEGRSGGSVALKAGGKGDVTDANTVWYGRDQSRFGSPLIFDGRLYYFSNGMANCIDAKDGESVFKERLSSSGGSGQRGGDGGFGFGGGGRFGGQDYSSAVTAGGNIYYIKSSGDCHVIKAGDQFELVATNRVTDEREIFNGTPAISHNCLFLRSDKRLYCVGAE